MNFHPDTFEIVKFQDKYEMSEESYLIFLGALEEKMSELCGEKWPDQREWFIEDYFTKEIFMSELKTEKYSCAYYTDTTVGISVDVPFVLCDHIEFEIPYEEVTQFAIEK